MGRRAGYIFSWLFPSLFIFCLTSGAQDQYRIMDWKTGTTLRTYLLQTMHNQYDQRRLELALSLKSETAMSEYRERCRDKYLRLAGVSPDTVPLNAHITKQIPQSGYTVENIVFESRPSHHVTANLYIPRGKGPFPAVLIFCGHEMSSKATLSYQKTAILFALNGFVAMVVDPVSQGERVQFTDSTGQRILRGSTTEHTLLNAGANLTGTGVVSWELFDNKRALDLLVSMPVVDPGRIGCLGNSGGGTQTTYFIAFDERIKVAAPCSYIARRERNFELAGASDGCQHLPSEGEAGLEIADFLIMFAPKPLIILTGRYDFVDYTGTVETFDELSSVYKLYGADEKLKLFTYDDGHGISMPKRKAAVEWFALWLRNEKINVIEKSLPVLDEAALNCTPAGQVNSSFTGERDLQDFNLTRAYDLEVQRKKFLNESTECMKQEKLRSLLSVVNNDSIIDTEVSGVIENREYILKKIILRREGEVPLPCLYYTPSGDTRMDTVILWLNEEGKDKIASKEENILPLVRSGFSFILADLRGMGETAEMPEANDWKYYNREYHNAMLGLHIGKPLPGQRVEDIITLMNFIKGEPGIKGLPVRIIATGAAAPSAVFAAALDKNIVAVDASSTISSYSAILENPMDKDWYSYVIPGILQYFDLPDIVKIRRDLRVTY